MKSTNDPIVMFCGVTYYWKYMSSKTNEKVGGLSFLAWSPGWSTRGFSVLLRHAKILVRHAMRHAKN